MLSDQNLHALRHAVAKRGLAAVARDLEINRSSLSAVLLGHARPSTQRAVAAAFIDKAAKVLEGVL